MARLRVGDRVVLSSCYKSCGDAASGPLSPGDVGEIITTDGTDVPYKVQFGPRTHWYREKALEKYVPPRGVKVMAYEVEFDYRTWWYPQQALQKHPSSDTPPEAELVIGDFAVLSRDYQKFPDAVKGPLWPGVAGKIVACHVQVDSRTWWYDKPDPKVLAKHVKRGGSDILEAAGDPCQAQAQLSVGDKVVLSSDFRVFADAEHGPLAEGDVGTVLECDRSHLPYRVAFGSSTFWYAAGAIEKQVAKSDSDGSEATTADTARSPSTRPIKVGDMVRVSPAVTEPRCGWGGVNHSMVGVVVAEEGDYLRVNFPAHKFWRGGREEFEKVAQDEQTLGWRLQTSGSVALLSSESLGLALELFSESNGWAKYRCQDQLWVQWSDGSIDPDDSWRAEALYQTRASSPNELAPGGTCSHAAWTVTHDPRAGEIRVQHRGEGLVFTLTESAARHGKGRMLAGPSTTSGPAPEASSTDTTPVVVEDSSPFPSPFSRLHALHHDFAAMHRRLFEDLHSLRPPPPAPPVGPGALARHLAELRANTQRVPAEQATEKEEGGAKEEGGETEEGGTAAELRTCGECGQEGDDGWTSYGDYYCINCWAGWLSHSHSAPGGEEGGEAGHEAHEEPATAEEGEPAQQQEHAAGDRPSGLRRWRLWSACSRRAPAHIARRGALEAAEAAPAEVAG